MSLRFTVSKRNLSIHNGQQPFLPTIPHKSQVNLPKLGIVTQVNNIFSENSYNSTRNDGSLKSKQKESKSNNKDPAVDVEVPKVISISANREYLVGEIEVPSLPPLPAFNDPSFDNIFKEKIKLCNILFDFDHPNVQLEGKKAKVNALIEINKILAMVSNNSSITEKQKDAIYDMITKNLFHQDPFISNEKICFSTLKQSIVEPSWEHMCHVYQALIQFLITFPERCKISLAKKLIRLMNIPDNNERENLVTLLKNYAETHPEQLENLYELLKSALVNVGTDIYTPYCVEPVLTFLKMMVRKDYIYQIIYTHLLPLYRHEKLYLYSSKLSNLITSIISNKPVDQINYLKYLLNHFPLQCGQKQLLFVYAINSLFNIIGKRELNQVSTKIILFFASAFRSPNSKLVESSLKIFLKPVMTSILFSNAAFAMDNLLEPLKWTSTYHWDKSIKILSSRAYTTLSNIKYEVQSNSSSKTSRDPINEISLKNSPKETKKLDNSDLVSKWALIARSAAKKYNSIDLTNSLLEIQSKLLNEGMNNGLAQY